MHTLICIPIVKGTKFNVTQIGSKLTYFEKSYIPLSLARHQVLELAFMGMLIVSVTSFAKSKLAFIQLSSLGISKKKGITIKWHSWNILATVVWIIYKFWNKWLFYFFLIFQSTLHLKFRSSYMEEVKSSYSKTPLQQRPYNQKVQRPIPVDHLLQWCSVQNSTATKDFGKSH